MNFKHFLLVSIVLISCKDKTEKFNYETSIASKVYQAQIKYLDNTLFNYARISKIGDFYFQENSYLDKIANEFKIKINYGRTITTEEQKIFYEHL